MGTDGYSHAPAAFISVNISYRPSCFAFISHAIRFTSSAQVFLWILAPETWCDFLLQFLFLEPQSIDCHWWTYSLFSLSGKYAFICTSVNHKVYYADHASTLYKYQACTFGYSFYQIFDFFRMPDVQQLALAVKISINKRVLLHVARLHSPSDFIFYILRRKTIRTHAHSLRSAHSPGRGKPCAIQSALGREKSIVTSAWFNATDAVRASLRSTVWDAREDDVFIVFPQVGKVPTHKSAM